MIMNYSATSNIFPYFILEYFNAILSFYLIHYHDIWYHSLHTLRFVYHTSILITYVIGYVWIWNTHRMSNAKHVCIIWSTFPYTFRIESVLYKSSKASFGNIILLPGLFGSSSVMYIELRSLIIELRPLRRYSDTYSGSLPSLFSNLLLRLKIK